MKRLACLLVTVWLNVAFLAVSVCWLVSQNRMFFAWAEVGTGEHSVTVGPDGWMWQWKWGLRALPQAQRYGFRSESVLNTELIAWNNWGNLQRPMPGLFCSSEGTFRSVSLIALRHWLVFLFAVTCWSGWQSIERWRRRRNAET